MEKEDRREPRELRDEGVFKDKDDALVHSVSLTPMASEQSLKARY